MPLTEGPGTPAGVERAASPHMSSVLSPLLVSHLPIHQSSHLPRPTRGGQAVLQDVGSLRASNREVCHRAIPKVKKKEVQRVTFKFLA